MSAYAIGHLRTVTMGPGIVAYLKGIDATLTPFDGRFIIHGGSPEIKEGQWSGDLIVIEFPSLDHVRAWYQSQAYQDILSFRADNSDGAIFFIDGAPADHRATDVLG